MSSTPRHLWAVLPLLILAAPAAHAFEQATAQDDFIARHMDTLRNAAAVSRPGWTGAVEWTGRGLNPAEQVPDDRALGARLRVMNDFTLSTEMVRTQSREPTTTGALRWGYGFERKAADDITFGLTASGAVDSQAPRPTHTVGGSVKVALPLDGLGWTARVSLASSATLHASQAVASLTPSLSGERVLTSAASPYRAKLGVSVGTAMTAAAAPNLTTRLELRITPQLR